MTADTPDPRPPHPHAGHTGSMGNCPICNRPVSPPSELTAALETLRTSLRTDPADRFWEGWDAALMAVEVAMDPRPPRAAPQADAGLREAQLWQLALARSIQDAGITDDAETAWTMAANVNGQLDSRGVVLAVASRGPAAPAGLDVEKAANDVRHGGHHLDSYWEGFNDGVDALVAALGAAQEKGEAGSDLERELAEDRRGEQEHERLVGEMERAGYEHGR